MRETLNKLWTAFFVAVLLFVVAVFVAGQVAMANPDCFTCGSRVGLTFWLMGVGAHQPILWTSNILSFFRRLSIWLTALVVGFITYLGVEALAVGLLAPGHGWRAVQLGFAANLIGVMVASAVSHVLVRRSSRRRQGSSPLAATRQSTQRLERQMIVTGEDVQDEGQTQTDTSRLTSPDFGILPKPSFGTNSSWPGR